MGWRLPYRFIFAVTSAQAGGEGHVVWLPRYGDRARLRRASDLLPEAGSLFFACPKKSNQKKRHPRLALAGLKARQVREGWPGFSTGHPCPVEKGSASVPIPLTGLIVHPSPPHRGPVSQKRQARAAAPRIALGEVKAKCNLRQLNSDDSFLIVALAFGVGFWRATRAALALDLRDPMARRVGGGKPEGWPAWTPASFSTGQGRPVEKPRNPPAYPKGAPSGCSFFWLLFFEHAKKSDPAIGRSSEARRRRARSRFRFNKVKPSLERTSRQGCPSPQPSPRRGEGAGRSVRSNRCPLAAP